MSCKATHLPLAYKKERLMTIQFKDTITSQFLLNNNQNYKSDFQSQLKVKFK